MKILILFDEINCREKKNIVVKYCHILQNVHYFLVSQHIFLEFGILKS